MDINRFLILYFILQSVFIFLDIYVIGSFARFVKAKGWSMWIIYSLIFFAVVIAMLSSWGFSERLDRTGDPVVQHYLFMLVMLWYLPKFMILPFMAVTHLSSLIARLSNRKHIKTIDDIRSLNAIADSEKGKEKGSDDKQSVTPVDETIEKHEPKGNVFNDRFKRREFIRNMGWSLAGMPFIITGYGALKTLYDFEVNKLSISIHNLPREYEGIRIVQISDIHLGSFPDYKPFQEIRRIVNSLKADITVITGDFVNFDPMEMKPHFGEIQQLDAEIGVFACLGNHDHYMSQENHLVLRKAISASGIDEINNSNRIISIDGEKLNIMGVDNIGMNQQFGSFTKAYQDVVQSAPTILLCHDPRNWDNTVLTQYNDIDLMLSGHTHGGQFAVELLGMDLHPVSLFYKRYAGLYSKDKQYLYVNRGVGTTGPPVRIGVNPEITEFTLTRANT